MMSSDKFSDIIHEMRFEGRALDNDGKYWSEESIIELIQLFHEGKGISEMAYHFLRSESAIYQQLEKMNCFSKIKKRRNRTSSENECRCIHCKIVKTCVYSPENRGQLHRESLCDEFQEEIECDDV